MHEFDQSTVLIDDLKNGAACPDAILEEETEDRS
jgi:hypothetical protein